MAAELTDAELARNYKCPCCPLVVSTRGMLALHIKERHGATALVAKCMADEAGVVEREVNKRLED